MPMYLEKTGLGPSFKSIFGVPAEKFCDRLVSFIGKKFVLDILMFDKWLGEQDPEYDPENATYKGKPASMNEYLVIKYGQVASDIIKKLI